MLSADVLWGTQGTAQPGLEEWTLKDLGTLNYCKSQVKKGLQYDRTCQFSAELCNISLRTVVP